MLDVHWTGQGVIKPSTDPDGTVDLGSVDALNRVHGTYQAQGDWGEILLPSDLPSLSIASEPTA
ncbi:hypothetical protein [Streptomyces adustus]|uniref:hypothetical protein n=1 Tax=Streptomyces adustus TaxID=1609272 RepID=UPI0037178877